MPCNMVGKDQCCGWNRCLHL